MHFLHTSYLLKLLLFVLLLFANHNSKQLLAWFNCKQSRYNYSYLFVLLLIYVTQTILPCRRRYSGSQ